jgi:hypothetical protein
MTPDPNPDKVPAEVAKSGGAGPEEAQQGRPQGITNRSLDEEQRQQEKLPPRGEAAPKDEDERSAPVVGDRSEGRVLDERASGPEDSQTADAKTGAWAMGIQTSAGKSGLASSGKRQTRRQGPPTVAGAFAKQGTDREMEGKLKTAGRRRRRKAA